MDEIFFCFTFALMPGLGAKSNKKSSLLYVAYTFTHESVSFHTQQAGLVQSDSKRSNSVIAKLIIVLHLICFLE